MDCEVTSYKNHQVRSVRTSQGFSFDSVKDDALLEIETGIADRVEIKDMEGKLLWHHPRVTRPGASN